jgi:hypothetical protein
MECFGSWTSQLGFVNSKKKKIKPTNDDDDKTMR